MVSISVRDGFGFEFWLFQSVLTWNCFLEQHYSYESTVWDP